MDNVAIADADVPNICATSVANCDANNCSGAAAALYKIAGGGTMVASRTRLKARDRTALAPESPHQSRQQHDK